MPSQRCEKSRIGDIVASVGGFGLRPLMVLSDFLPLYSLNYHSGDMFVMVFHRCLWSTPQKENKNIRP
jgi:hypothetical protein